MKVLMCTGGSRFAEDAIKFGIRLVKNASPEITLFSVIEKKVSVEKPEEAIERAAHIIKENGFTPEIKTKEGFVTEEVIKEAEDGSYDLVVIGSHGQRSSIIGVSKFLLGAEAYRVIRYCKTSVLVVKESKSFNKVLFTTDGSKCAEKAIDFGADLLQDTKTAVTIIHVIPAFVEHFKDYLEPVTSDLIEILKTLPRREAWRLDRSKDIFKKYGIVAERKVREGDAAEEILKESERYDMIVMGSLGRKSSGKFIMGDVSSNVVTHAKKPVLLYRSKP